MKRSRKKRPPGWDPHRRFSLALLPKSKRSAVDVPSPSRNPYCPTIAGTHPPLLKRYRRPLLTTSLFFFLPRPLLCPNKVMLVLQDVQLTIRTTRTRPHHHHHYISNRINNNNTSKSLNKVSPSYGSAATKVTPQAPPRPQLPVPAAFCITSTHPAAALLLDRNKRRQSPPPTTLLPRADDPPCTAASPSARSHPWIKYCPQQHSNNDNSSARPLRAEEVCAKFRRRPAG